MVSLENVEINQVSDRAAMALPEHYSPTRFASVAGEIAELRGEPLEALVALTEGSSAPVARRFAAGALLGLAG
ncbi:MAG TPA: hypothetical protein VFD36_27265, partial [Kofleriaceae bacterium]|nr:hypothetical protein [Kofleriaceae bacterium]